MTIRKNDAPQHMYFYRSGPHIKIGISIDPIERMKQVWSPTREPIEIVGMIPNMDRRDEWHIHERFKQSCVGGEWFVETSDLTKFIEDHAEKPFETRAHTASKLIVVNFRAEREWRTRLKCFSIAQRRTLESIVVEAVSKYMDEIEATQ